MSKIICDVCGTLYPETAVQCPICGCVRPGEVKVVAGDTSVQPEEKVAPAYTHVKGGRFSKANVRKRNIARGIDDGQDNVKVPDENEKQSQEPENDPKNKTDLGLTITVIALLLAIVAVVAYIIIRFFVPVFGNPGATTEPEITTTVFSEETTTLETEEATTTEETLNTEFHVDENVELTQQNETFQLAVVGVGEDDTVTFESSDESIATVDEEGVITAVSEGEVVITVKCGEKQAICTVVITFAADETDPTEDTTVPEDEATAPTEVVDLNYKISHKEVTLLTGVEERKSFTLTLKDEQGNVVDVEWRDDKGLCKIEGNKIIAEKVGNTVIYAVINGVKYPDYSCALVIWYDV